MKKKKYHYFYKITNNINNHFYYGIHSTDNLDDEYMGSGHRLLRAYKKYGVENFSKEILKYFENREEAALYEFKIVNEELLTDNKCYNCIIGGEKINTIGKCVVYDTTVGITKLITQEEYHTNQKHYISPNINKISVIDKNTNKCVYITSEEYHKNREKYINFSEGKVTVSDKNGNIYRVSTNDERYLNRNLKFIWEGRKHTEETKQKQCETYRKNGHQQGIKNSQYGKCWIYKDDVSITILKEDKEKYISEGWKLGRKCSMKTNKMDKIDINIIFSLRKKGFLWKEIQEKLNISKNTLYRIRKKYNIEHG